LHEAAGVYHFNKHIFWPFQLILSLPFWLTTILVPALSTYVAFINDCERQIKAIKCGQKDKFAEKANPTIFHELLEGDLPASEKSVERLVQEGNVLIGAGTETTAWCLSVITYHLLSQPPLLKKLQDELRAAIPDPNQLVRLETLESLPYLKACIQEGLRLGYGNSSRLQRSCPDKDIVFNDGEKDWYIPPGVSLLSV
jgi:cytochrome P450